MVKQDKRMYACIFAGDHLRPCTIVRWKLYKHTCIRISTPYTQDLLILLPTFRNSPGLSRSKK